jgi:predicted amidohydrolase
MSKVTEIRIPLCTESSTTLSDSSFQEIWNCPYSNDSFPVYAEDIDAGFEASPSSAMLSNVAREKKLTIVGGSIPERSNGHLYNTCCVFDKDGELKAKHRKVYTFLWRVLFHFVFHLFFVRIKVT